MTETTGIFKQIEEHSFTIDKCFLCGCILTKENNTVEHVIPKWLQHQFNLWDQKITLLNGSLFPYRLLTIPCCFECNNNYLRPFEDKIKQAFDNGYEAFKQLDKKVLFLWLGKIYFGNMYRELFLNADKKNLENGTITNPTYLKSFYAHFLFLQGIRQALNFNNYFPASIFFFKTQKPKKIEDQWDFIDNHNTLFIAVRMGDIGIISPLQDCESILQFDDLIYQHNDIELHPLQFREMAAKILYKRILMNRTPKFVNIQQEEGIESHLMPFQGLSHKPVFDNWDNGTYSQILSEITGVPREICQLEEGKVWTWMKNDKGDSIFIPIED